MYRTKTTSTRALLVLGLLGFYHKNDTPVLFPDRSKYLLLKKISVLLDFASMQFMKSHLEGKFNISYQVRHIHSFSTKIKSTNAVKDLGVTVDTRLNVKVTVSSHCKKCKPQAGVHQEEHGQQVEGSFHHLCSTVRAVPGVQGPVPQF